MRFFRRDPAGSSDGEPEAGAASGPDRRFAAFDRAFPASSDRQASAWTAEDTTAQLGVSSDLLTAFLAEHARASYLDGLLRVVLPDGQPDLRAWNGERGWAADWPAERGLRVFAHDWLGRLYGVDPDGRWGRRAGVARLSPGIGEVEAISRDVERFLVRELPEERDDLLSADYFAEWRRANGPLEPTDCASYRVPLFLGGTDDVENLERSSLVVHLSVSGQIWAQVRDLPDGTPIGEIALRPPE